MPETALQTGGRICGDSPVSSAPSVTSFAPSQQSPPASTMAAVTGERGGGEGDGEEGEVVEKAGAAEGSVF